ncbi:LamG domain-containing protein [Tepidiforma sp.]|uniref:LamG domain-containing protein n=1 Tax=Tepidiforma sp. TaxID=2682230 RepID=UPI002ADD6DC9|nr:LamG domain-containing protein [Tepidiforma sp.]
MRWQRLVGKAGVALAGVIALLSSACWFGGGGGPPKAVCVPPPADLVAWWTFDEPAGPVAHDIAGWPNDLVFGGNPAAVGGMVGGGWSIPNGVGGSTPDQGDLALGTGSFTLEFWISRWDQLSNISRILGKLGGGNVGYEVIFANGQVGMRKSGATVFPSPWSGVAWSTGWRHVAVTVDRGAGNVVRWYVDGQQTAQAPATNWFVGNLDTTAPALVGGPLNDGFGIDELSLYRRALGPGEIQAIYGAGSLGKCKPVPPTPTATSTTGSALLTPVPTVVGPKGTPTPTATATTGPTLLTPVPTVVGPKGTPTPTVTATSGPTLLTPVPTVVGPKGTPTPTATSTPTPRPTWTPTWTPTATPSGGRAVVCIRKFYDDNGNGVQEATEPYLGGWSFTVATSSTVATVVSSVGAAECAVVPAPGSVTVTEVLQPGWVNTTALSQTVTVSAGSTTTLVFGNRRQ